MSFTAGAVNGAVTKIANVDVAANRLVALHTDPTRVVYPSGAGAIVYGVTMHSATAGNPVMIAKDGEFPVACDGNVANIGIGTRIISEGTGGLGRLTTGSPACIVGAALQASTAAADVILVDLKLQFI